VAIAASVAACALLSGCFGSGGASPTAAHRHRHHRTTSSSPADPSSSSSPASPSSSAAPVSALKLSPRSGGKHNDDCEKLVPGDDPAEFLYYPVWVRATSPVHLDSITTDHTQGVADADAWVAPAGPTPETGTTKGWPPGSIVTGDPNLQWSKRMTAAGTTLAAGPSYNVFLRLRVDPTPGDSTVSGIVFAYHDDSGSHTDTWVIHTTFSMSC
jgi:hypothetical protein